MPRTLYLIDGHAQIYRAYYAPFGNLRTPTGEPTRATHVFFQMLLNLLRGRKPDYLVMVMDVSDETVFRKDFYPQYKAHRDPSPEDLGPQIDRIVSVLEAVRVPILRKPGFEADDLMATLVERFAGDDELETYLVSKDKDLDQLLSARVNLYDPAKDEVISPAKLFELKGWHPAQAVDAQTLIGDSVDNVPGVEGVGPKTAAKLLQKYGTFEAIVANADGLPPKQKEKLLAFMPQKDVTRRLVTLRRDVPIEFDLPAAAVERFAWWNARPVFEQLGFRRLTELLPTRPESEPDLGEVSTATPEASAAPPPSPAETQVVGVQEPSPTLGLRLAGPELRSPDGGEYILIDTPERFEQLVGELAAQREFALDTETTSVNPIDADLVGLSFAWQIGRGYYVPVRSMYDGVVPLELIRSRLAPLLADPRIGKVGHNIKYDLIVLRQAGLPVAGPLFDTMVAAFVLDPTRLSYAMDRLVLDLLGHHMIPITDLIGSGRDQLGMDQVPLAQVAEYAAEDADYTWRMRALFGPQLHGSDLHALFYDTEMPLCAVLTDMESNGVRIDTGLLKAMSAEMAAKAEALETRAHELAQTRFNLDSPKQLAEVLFDKLGFRVVRRTKTARSTDAETLEELHRETAHPLLALLLEYREVQKLRGTYVDALPQALSRRTGRVHTSYHQTGAITGRLSSSEPNLQNIPVRTELGRQIRRAFVPREADELLIVADYSQIELRVLAHFCEDEALIRAFAEDRDIHAVVAAQVNGVALDAVTRDMRGRAKAVNFGLIYGQTAFGLAQTTGMSRTEAQLFIDNYFRQYPRIRGFIDQCIAEARRQGYVQTILGRRRPIRDIDSRNRMARAQAERLSVNTVVQGSAADLIKLAMIQLDERIRRERLPLRMLLQVHDELVLEGPRDGIAQLAAVVSAVMAGAMKLRVPLKVDVETAPNWLDAK